MKPKFIPAALALLVLFANLNSQISTAHAQGTAFTYEGRLNDGGAPANGRFFRRPALSPLDIRFLVY